MKKELFKIEINYTPEKIKKASVLVNKKYFIIMSIVVLLFAISWILFLIKWEFFYWIINLILGCLMWVPTIKVYRQDGVMNQIKFKYHKENATIMLTFKEDKIEVYENETKWSYILYYEQVLSLKESKDMFCLVMGMPKCFHMIEKPQLKEENITKFREFINNKIKENKKDKKE